MSAPPLRGRFAIATIAAIAASAGLALSMAGCMDREGASRRDPQSDPSGQPVSLAQGEAAFRRHGCGACHLLSAMTDARGVVGPSLDGLRDRVYLAGHLPNSEAHRVLIIQRPHQVDPHTAMPTIGISSHDARAIAAFLVAR